MGLRTKAYFIGAFLTFFSSIATALGLGEIKLNSSLNQPLNAEIRLLHLRGLTERDILIGIASPDEFERAGVERNYFVTELKFNIDLSAAGGPVVRLTSETPVREPFVNFVVSAQWPSGRLLREYTLLVDLPVFSGNRAAPVQAAAPAAETPSPIAARETPTRSSPAEAVTELESTPDAPAYASDTYGPVGANETLWSIASRIKPDGSVSVQQTMLAIQRLNPDAFIKDNINLLRRGQVLRIPDKQEIEKLTTREAVREVAQQNNSWGKRAEEPEKAQLEGSRSFSQTRDEPSAVEGRIKLSSPTSASQSGQGTGVGEGEEGSGITQALTQAQEELDAADRENNDMKSRLQSMEEQIQTMEKLMEVSSEEMRALELAAQQTNQAEELTAETAETAPETAEQPAEQSATAPQPDAVAPVQETMPAPPKPPVTPAKAWMDLAMENILYIGIAAGVLVLGLAAFFFMRKRKDEYSDEFDEDFGGDSNREFDVADDLAFDQDDKTLPLFDGDSDVVEELGRRPVLAEAETEDVVGECDIHIAYGQYDQAEEKLLRALEKDPSRVPVRLKLMEVFAAQGDGDNFDSHYARLQLMADTEALDRAALLRSSIDGIGEFDAAAYDTSDFSYEGQRTDTRMPAYKDDEASDLNLADDTLDFDFDQVDDLVDASSKTRAADEVSALGDLDFDLHLDIETDDITRIPEKTAKQQDEQTFETDLADLEFELGDLDSDTSLEDASLDFDLPEVSAKSPQSDDDLSFDFEQPHELIADTFDDLDTGLDLGSEQFTSEFSDNLVAESASTDFAADLDDFADLTDDRGALTAVDDALDFDLDRDLESAKSIGEDAGVPGLDDDEAEDGLADLGLDDLQDLDLDLETTTDKPKTTAAPAAAKVSDDFDMDFDLDNDINLDQLDHELDQLASDFGNTSPVSGIAMEEPVIDFDEPVFDEPVAEDVPELIPEDQTLDDILVADTDTLKKPGNISKLSVKSAVSSDEAANSTLDFEIPDFDPENDDDSNLDFLSDNDETATKLDLARAYIDMGDSDGAKDILDEILDEGNDQQKREAEALLSRIG
jgi:pilus assembly protein FimV